MTPSEPLRAFSSRESVAFAADSHSGPVRFAPSHPGRRQPSKATRGFTLIELLVALAAMALLSIMSWRGIDGMLRTQEITRTQGEQHAILQTVLAQWNADLNTLMPLQGRQVLDWDGQVLRLTRKTSAPIDNGALVVAWSRRNVDGQLQWVRWQSLPARTVSEWNDAWSQASQWGRNPSSDQMRRETVLLPLDLWRVYYYRSNAWTNPLSSDQNSADNESSRTLPKVPDGVRIELTLPAGRALNGVMTVDWVNPLRSNNRS